MTLPDITTPEALAKQIDQPFYDLPDVAMKLGNCSRSTLYRLIEQNKLVRVRMGGRQPNAIDIICILQLSEFYPQCYP